MEGANLFDRRSYWLDHHQKRLSLGMPVEEYCEREGIKSPTYRKALSRYGFESKKETGRFIELTPSVESCLLEISYNGFQLRIFSDSNLELLANTLRVLQGLS